MARADQFARNLRAFSKDFRERAEERIKEDACKVAIAAAIQTSPVDTGFFVSNWDVADAGERPQTGEFGSYKELLARKRAGGAAGDIQAQVANRANEKCETLKLGDTIEIANATPYGIYLEEGTSRQAPRGILRNIVAAVRARVGR